MESRGLSAPKNLRGTLAVVAVLGAVLGLAGVCPRLAQAQTAATLAQVRKIYVEPFGGKRGAGEIRDQVIDRLKRDAALTIVGNAAQSDAVLKGNGEIWVSGYVGNNPRAQASNRSPVYSGYLSLTLEGGKAQPLWSYLVTPAASLSGTITSNLAGRGAKLLIAAAARDRESGASSPSSSAPSAAGAQQSLTGAGATFPAPLYEAWIEALRQAHPELHIRYEAVGSESGMERLVGKEVDFAASDIAAWPEGTAVQRFATALGAVVPIYNLRGVDRALRFTPEILADIYLGKISRWDDPRILAVNRGASLPNAAIAVVHRSDGSGTTYAFTDFLSKTSAAWKAKVGAGSAVAWPTGSGAARNDGVASLVEATPNSIGYVELTYAIQQELSYGAVRNAAGVYVTANLESVAAAARSAASSAAGAPASITDAPGKASYPIASFTWIVLPDPVPAGERGALAQMLEWMLSSGQKESSALGYAPLPRELAGSELESLAKLK